MKMQATGLLKPLSQERLLALTTEVKEVLVVDYKKNSDRIFSAADLWNIQRRQRTILPRR